MADAAAGPRDRNRKDHGMPRITQLPLGIDPQAMRENLREVQETAVALIAERLEGGARERLLILPNVTYRRARKTTISTLINII